MPQTLPTFRTLATTAATNHLSIAPGDGSALVLENLTACTPYLDAQLVLEVQRASASLEGACAVLAPLRGLPAVATAYTIAMAARRAYHVAIMAGFGVDVCGSAHVCAA